MSTLDTFGIIASTGMLYAGSRCVDDTAPTMKAAMTAALALMEDGHDVSICTAIWCAEDGVMLEGTTLLTLTATEAFEDLQEAEAK